MDKKSSFLNYTRGGQITLHNLRMFYQITQKVFFTGMLFFLALFSFFCFLSLSKYQLYLLSEYFWGKLLPLIDSSVISHFVLPSGKIVTIPYKTLNASPFMHNAINLIYLILIKNLLWTAFITFVLISSLSYWLRRKGEVQSIPVIIKGDRLAEKDETKSIIKKAKQASDLKLAGLPLIKNKETAHFLFHGTTGSGKTNALSELLEQIRARGDRAIIYDKGGVFLEKFFRPGFDKLLNPLDERGEGWDLWQECRDSADFDNLAAALIPMPPNTQDPFWVNGARAIFAATAFQMRNESSRHHLELLQYLLTADNEKIENYLKGTYAETLVSEKIEKTAISIKSVLATYLKSLKYLHMGDNPFSIRKWIHNEEGKEWLFISSIGDRNETLKPIIAAYLDIAINTLLSLPQNESRRIFIILDEFQSLQRLPYIKSGLAEGRKFGACFVIGAQDYPGIADIYGQNGADSISTLLNTRLMFREPDSKVAQWAARNLGETVLKEAREGLSYGANTMRDGITINHQETTKQLVSYSEIMTLDDLCAFIRLPGSFPITKLHFEYKNRPKINEGYVLRDIDETEFEKVNNLINKYDTKYSPLVQSKPSTHPRSKIKKTKKRDNANEQAFDI